MRKQISLTSWFFFLSMHQDTSQNILRVQSLFGQSLQLIHDSSRFTPGCIYTLIIPLDLLRKLQVKPQLARSFYIEASPHRSVQHTHELIVRNILAEQP